MKSQPGWTLRQAGATISTMSTLLERIRSDVRLLTAEEQRALAVDLFDASWGPYDPAAEVKAAWDAEITSRAEDIRAGNADVIPWASVQADLAKEFGWDK